MSAVDRILRKCEARLDEGVGEVDEMALVGMLSVMLLHDQFVAHPQLAAPAVATKVVTRGSVSTSAPAAVAL